MPVQITMEMPVDAFSVLRKSPEDFARELALAGIVKWYEMGLVSQAKAAHLAGISRERFLFELSRHGASPFQETPEEIDEALSRG
jgi:predicted HTH domain antitoxin